MHVTCALHGSDEGDDHDLHVQVGTRGMIRSEERSRLALSLVGQGFQFGRARWETTIGRQARSVQTC